MRRVTGSRWITDLRGWTWPEVVILGADQRERCFCMGTRMGTTWNQSLSNNVVTTKQGERAGMAQWWKRSPLPACPRFDSGPYHMWADSVGGSCLPTRLFLQVLPFSFFQKNQHSKFQFDKDRGPTWKPTKANAIIFFLQTWFPSFADHFIFSQTNFVFCKGLILAQGNVFTQH